MAFQHLFLMFWRPNLSASALKAWSARFATGLAMWIPASIIALVGGCYKIGPTEHGPKNPSTAWFDSPQQIKERQEALSDLSKIRDNLSTQSSPITIAQISDNLSLPPKRVQDSLEYAIASPARVLWDDHSEVVINPDFFKQNLSAAITYQGQARWSKNNFDILEFQFSNHLPLKVTLGSRSQIIKLSISSEYDRSSLDQPPLPFLKIYESSSHHAESLDERPYRFKIDESSLAFFGRWHSGKEEVWVRDVRFRQHEFTATPYLSIEYALASTNGAIHLVSLTIFPSVRQTPSPFNSSVVHKVLSLIEPSWGTGNLFSKSVALTYPSIHQDLLPMPWYLDVHDQKMYEGELGEIVIESVGQGIESWNLYAPPESPGITKFHGLAPPGIRVGDYGYFFVTLDRLSTTIAHKIIAYASYSLDQSSGLITSGLAYVPTSWISANYLDQDDDLEHQILVTPDDQQSHHDDHQQEKQGTDRSRTSLESLGSHHLVEAGFSASDFQRINEPARDNSVKSYYRRMWREAYNSKTGRSLARDIHTSNHHLTGDLWNFWKENPRFFEFQMSAFRGTVYHEVGHTLGMAHNFKGSMVAFDEYPTTGMDYLTPTVEIGLFQDGLLAQPLSYDQAYIDAHFNNTSSEEVEQLPSCSNHHAWGYGIDLFDAERKELFRGIDPFCHTFDIFVSVGAGLHYMNIRLLENTKISGYNVSSFVSSLSQPPTVTPESLEEPFSDQAPSQNPAATVEVAPESVSLHHSGSSSSRSVMHLLASDGIMTPSGYDKQMVREWLENYRAEQALSTDITHIGYSNPSDQTLSEEGYESSSLISQNQDGEATNPQSQLEEPTDSSPIDEQDSEPGDQPSPQEQSPQVPPQEQSNNLREELEVQRQLVIDRFTKAVGDYFSYHPPSYYDIVSRHLHRLITWKSYEDMLEDHRWSFTETGMLNGSVFKSVYDLFGLTNGPDILESGQDLLIKSGLSRFTYPLEYTNHEVAEKTLLIGIFSDVLRMVMRQDNFEVFNSPIKFAEIACGLEDDVLLVFDHTSECVEVLTPHARRVIFSFSDEFLNGLLNFFDIIKRLHSYGSNHVAVPIVKSYLSTDIIRQLIERVTTIYDFKSVIERGSAENNHRLELSVDELNIMLNLAWLLLNRNAQLDDSSVNYKKAELKVLIRKSLRDRLAKIDEALGDKVSEGIVNQLLNEKANLLDAQRSFNWLPCFSQEHSFYVEEDAALAHLCDG